MALPRQEHHDWGFLLLPKTSASVVLFAAVMGLTWLGTVPLTSGLVEATVVAGLVAAMLHFPINDTAVNVRVPPGLARA